MGSPIRLGLCCLFQEQPIRFRTSTAAYLKRLGAEAGRAHRAMLVTHNFETLVRAIECCHDLGIGAFRVNSQIVPVATHADWRFDLDSLKHGALGQLLAVCRERARALGIRLSMHPDQFVVLSAHRESVVDASIAELEYQAAVCEGIGADVLNIHGGGGYGDKPAAMARFAENVGRLSEAARSRLTVENDDRTYAPSELLGLAETCGIPLVYDVHHHRCNPDGLSVEAATELALATWNREPLLHISSPASGWSGDNPRPHHMYIDPADFPESWLGLVRPVSIDVEAKAKEVAVLRLTRHLAQECPG
jgi:UV DNA damage endonuclease